MKKRFLLIPVAACLIGGMLAGCTVNINRYDPEEQVTKPQIETQEETPTAILPAETPTEAPTPSALGNKWQDMTFSLDGVTYKIPFAYSEIKNAGWSFNPADYGYENGYILNKDDKTTGTIYLQNDKYGKWDVEFSVGITNQQESPVDIQAGSVWTMNIAARKEPYPSLKLAGNITWNSTIEEAKAVYGEPDDTYHFEDDITNSGDVSDVLTYGSSWEGTGGIMKLTFKNNKLTEVRLEQW